MVGLEALKGDFICYASTTGNIGCIWLQDCCNSRAVVCMRFVCVCIVFFLRRLRLLLSSLWPMAFLCSAAFFSLSEGTKIAFMSVGPSSFTAVVFHVLFHTLLLSSLSIEYFANTLTRLILISHVHQPRLVLVAVSLSLPLSSCCHVIAMVTLWLCDTKLTILCPLSLSLQPVFQYVWPTVPPLLWWWACQPGVKPTSQRSSLAISTGSAFPQKVFPS